MDNSSCTGWILLAVGLLLLVAFGRLDLLAILLLISILLAWGLARMGDNRGKLTRSAKKG